MRTTCCQCVCNTSRARSIRSSLPSCLSSILRGGRVSSGTHTHTARKAFFGSFLAFSLAPPRAAPCTIRSTKTQGMRALFPPPPGPARPRKNAQGLSGWSQAPGRRGEEKDVKFQRRLPPILPLAPPPPRRRPARAAPPRARRDRRGGGGERGGEGKKENKGQTPNTLSLSPRPSLSKTFSKSRLHPLSPL